MSIQRYTNEPFGAFAKCENGDYILFTDHLAELHNLLSTLAGIRTALGVDEKPMLSELAGIVRDREAAHAAEIERMKGERDVLSQKLKLTEEELDEVQGKLDEAEEFSSASLALILRHVGEPEIEDDDFVSITDLEQAIMRHESERDAAVRERDAACEAIRKSLLINDTPQEEARYYRIIRILRAALANIEGGRNA